MIKKKYNYFISFMINGLIFVVFDPIVTYEPESNALTIDSVSITDKINFIITESIDAILPSPGTNTDSVSITDKISFIFTQGIPDAILSLEFNGITNSTENNGNQTLIDVLELDGNGDFIQISNETSIETISELTVTGWISPDYSQGSQEFSIISKEGLFKLSVNNVITPKQTAKFSIFDGIQWTDVSSNDKIDEKWTHLAVTFNGTSMQMFVNGNLTSTAQLSGQLLVNDDGELVSTIIDELSSDKDIVIGASINTKNKIGSASNQFSGQIDDIFLYTEQLEVDEIKSLYKQKQDHYNSLNVEEIDLDAILDEIIEEFSTKSPLVNSSPWGSPILLNGDNTDFS